MEESFSDDDLMSKDLTNTFIDQDVEYWAKYGSSLFPSVVINNSTFRGQMETQAVMNAICAGFLNPPKMCKKLLRDENIEHDLQIGVIYFDDGYHMRHIVGLCVVFTLALVCFLCFYRRYAKRQMKKTMDVQIESAVNHYISLSSRETDTELKHNGE